MLNSYKNYVSKSWQIINLNIPLFAAVGLLMVISTFTLNLIPVLGGWLSTLLWLGYLMVVKKMANSEEFGFEDILWCCLSFKRLLNAFLMSVLHSIGIIFGAVLLIIPGIWLAVSWSLAFPLFVRISEEKSGWECLKLSSQLVKGRWWWFAGLILVIVALNLMGLLLFGIGLLLTLPMSFIILNEVANDLLIPLGEPDVSAPKLGSYPKNPSFIRVSP